MSAMETTEIDRKEIEKFTKHFIYKFVQVVVHSRLGVRSATRSKLLASSDWFNLSIGEKSDVREATKAVFANRPVTLAEPVCVEITLRTSENEKMILEYWYLQLTNKTLLPDSNFSASMTVYNYISLLLKSLITVTRSTPAYTLSRHQSADSFRIFYEVHLQRPSTVLQKDTFRKQEIGSVPSPLGAIVAFVIYRTKLAICPRQSTSDLTSTIKDDHFNTLPVFKYNITKDRKDVNNTNRLREDTSVQNSVIVHGNGPESELRIMHKRPAFGSSSDAEVLLNDVAETEPPFASLLHHALGTSPPPTIINVKCSPSLESLRQEDNTQQSKDPTINNADSHSLHESTTSLTARDEFVLVELKAPFAGQEDELGRFYRDCQTAPMLTMFEQTCSLNDMMTSINDQLLEFEASAEEFNDFVGSLQEID